MAAGAEHCALHSGLDVLRRTQRHSTGERLTCRKAAVSSHGRLGAAEIIREENGPAAPWQRTAREGQRTEMTAEDSGCKARGGTQSREIKAAGETCDFREIFYGKSNLKRELGNQHYKRNGWY